jgi:enoyl-CoA hydratase
MDYEEVKFQKEDGVAVVTLHRPEVLNALNSRVFQRLREIFEALAYDGEVKVVVLTGAGDKAFAAGADIAELERLSPLEAREFALTAYRAQETIANLSRPTIAAINGYALGGGCELAMCCDLRIAATTAKLGQPEIGLGIIPGGGGTQRLARLIGVARAKELVFTGKVISATEALAMGLVNQVVPPEELMPTVMKLARDLAAKSGPALALAKRAIDQGCNLGLPAGLHYEIECFANCFATADHQEGIRAFLEKRRPHFQDR